MSELCPDPVPRCQIRRQRSTICGPFLTSPLTDSNRRPPPYHDGPPLDTTHATMRDSAWLLDIRGPETTRCPGFVDNLGQIWGPRGGHARAVDRPRTYAAPMTCDLCEHNAYPERTLCLDHLTESLGLDAPTVSEDGDGDYVSARCRGRRRDGAACRKRKAAGVGGPEPHATERVGRADLERHPTRVAEPCHPRRSIRAVSVSGCGTRRSWPGVLQATGSARYRVGSALSCCPR